MQVDTFSVQNGTYDVFLREYVESLYLFKKV